MRRMLPIDILINGKRIRHLVIDFHYQRKHRSTVNDLIIANLVRDLDQIEIEPEAVDAMGFKYFVTQPHFFAGKPYRLIWLLPPDDTYFGYRELF